MSIENIVQTVMTSKKYSNIIPETINRICNALNCDISDVIELEQDESTAEKG